MIFIFILRMLPAYMMIKRANKYNLSNHLRKNGRNVLKSVYNKNSEDNVRLKKNININLILAKDK